MMSALFERELELDGLAAAVASAAAGRGRTILVEGPSGIGKTSLLAATRTVALESGVTVLRARGAELERDFAYGVARQLFERVLADAPDADALQQGAAGRAAAMLGIGGRDADAPAGTAFTVLHGLYWLVVNVTMARGPVLLLVDDLHWADAASVRWLVDLAPRLPELPVALIGATWPEGIVSDPAGLGTLAVDPGVTVLRPAALSAEGVGELLDVELGSRSEPAFAAAARDATGGTPFLVRSLADGIREERLAPSAGSIERVEAIGARGAGRWLALRLRRLSSSATKLTRAVAVLESATVEEAGALAGLPPSEARYAADALIASDILAPGSKLTFRHSMLRAAAYAELTPDARAEGHRRAAETLTEFGATEERVVEHLSQAEPAGDAEVVERLLAAARAADRSGAPQSAAAYLRRALAEPPAPRQRSAVLLGLAIATLATGEPEAFDLLRDAMAAAQTPGERAEAGLVLIYALGREYRFAEVGAVVDDLQRTLPETDGELALQLEAALIMPTMLGVETAPATAARARALRARADQAPEPPREILATAAFLAVQSGEPAAVGIELGRRALAAGPLPLPAELPWFPFASIALVWAEAFDVVEPWLDRGLARARATSDAILFPESTNVRALLNVRRDRLQAAEADALLVLHGPWPMPVLFRDFATAELCESLVAQGRLDAAEALIAPLGDEPERGAITPALLRFARGGLRLAQARPAEALADFRGVGEVLAGLGITNPATLAWRSAAAEALIALGEPDQAAPLVVEEVGLARAFGTPRALAQALLVAGELDEAETLARSVPAPLVLARILTAQGARLSASGQPEPARAPLAEALELARSVAARGLAGELEDLLRAAGGEPTAGVQAPALTAQERRVAELAREGLTDAEIAQALFVAPHRVEQHLSSAMGKLGVATREELAAVLG